MRLAELLRQAGYALPAGARDVDVEQVTEDSRQVRPGALFVAVAGGRDDGALYIESAIERGAVAIASSRDALLDAVAAPCLSVPDTRIALARLASVLWGRPAERLRLSAVTGTKGKSTTAALMHAVATAAEERTGWVGTIGCSLQPGQARAPGLTTPASSQLHEQLAGMVKAGDTAAILEVSSIGIDQERVHGLSFESAVFTNLFEDHLDYHHDIGSYFAAKRRLFVGETAARQAVINADDLFGRRLLAERADALGFGADGSAAVRLVRLEEDRTGLGVELETPAGKLSLRSPLIGGFNASNLLAACAWGVQRGYPLDVVRQGLESVVAVDGRMERVDAGQPFLVLVDFAHTGPALVAALAALRPITPGRLIVVFGCGGDRGRERRSGMAEAAARQADIAIITSDNPRSESPEAIVAEVERSARASAGAAELYVEVDRAAAIELAVGLARADDTLIVAGKGHERFQLIGSQRVPFDDREVLRAALTRREGA